MLHKEFFIVAKRNSKLRMPSIRSNNHKNVTSSL